MTDEEKNEDPKIFVDEDWKQKAEAEKKALEEEIASQAEESAEAPAEGEYDLPPASFSSLLQEFSTRALVSMGMIQNPFSGEAQVDLKAAAYSIDMLAILQEKTEGNLEENESTYLGQLIAQLREAFLKVSAAGGGAEEGSEEGAASAGESPAEPAPEEEAAAPAEETDSEKGDA
ncbi:MAG: DUF1844 domain-containing protein [Planctomycetota bacterium]|nr:DUF1844 domain-containing protein [Planctomycetota bacterium]